MKKLILVLLLLGGCAYKPMHDPAVSKAENTYYEDLMNCRFLIQEQTSSFKYGYYEVKYVSKCMTGRGHSILDGE